MFRICGVISLFRKKSSGFSAIEASTWLCIVVFVGRIVGNACPVGWSAKAARSCIASKSRLRDGIKVSDIVSVWAGIGFPVFRR